MRRWLAALGVLTCGVLLPAAVFAQGAGATLAGAVKDTSGAVLPGVTVQAASNVLIERVRETVTDGTGQYRLVDLRPGLYTVTIALTGFNRFERTGVEITGTGVITINAELRVGSIEETVTVSGETPVVDLQSTTKERVMSKDVIDALPTGRHYFSFGVLVPGVVGNTSATQNVGGILGDTMSSVSTHGGREGDQRILQNGLNTMTLQTAGGNIGGAVPNAGATQEVAIDTAAASAERQTGGVIINFIPRDGGNTVRGSVFATAVGENQQASNFTQKLADQGLILVNKVKSSWDVNPGLGGPILRDKLWYYYTYRNNGSRQYAAGMFFNQNEYLVNNYTYVPNRNRPALARHGDWWDSQIRLTWQVNAKNKLAGTWDQQWKCQCPNSVNATVSPETSAEFRFPTQRLLHAEWWSPLTSKVLIEFVALHRTERWGNMHPRLSSEGGGVTGISAANFAAVFPQLVGVTQTIGDSGTLADGTPYQNPNGITFHGPFNTFNNTWVPNYTYRWAVSYITGAHAFKVGGQDSIGFQEQGVYIPTLAPSAAGAPLAPMRYRFASKNTPDQVTAFQTPYVQVNDENHDLGLFAQDRWTVDRLTLTLGIRFDYFKSSYPEQTVSASTLGRPAHTFPAEDNLNWKDVTPRLGASYDLQGDGKTALKVSLNKYIAGQSLGGLGSNTNPITRLVNTASRTWTDNGAGGGVAGDFVPQCDLTNAAKNGECGALPASQANFGTFTTSQITDNALRSGWNVRGYNWEFSVGVQRELLPRVSVDVAYFRRWYGNFTVQDNVNTVAGDYQRFNIVAPLDTRLPGGGGNTIAGFYDNQLTGPSTVQTVNSTSLSDKYGNQVEHWNGVDVGVNARLRNGLLLQGGLSTGRTFTDNCEIVAAVPESLNVSPGFGAPPVGNPDSFCSQTTPFLTQYKGVAAYTLPRYATLPTSLATALTDVQVAGTFQSVPGGSMSVAYQMPNAELSNPALSTLGRNLQNGTTKNVALLKGGTVFDERFNQLDLRIGRLIRYGRTRTSVSLDIFNVFNSDTVLTRNNTFTKSATPGKFAASQAQQADGLYHSMWVPTAILQARFWKVSVNFDF